MADNFNIHEWNKKRYLNEGIDISPIQADKIHKFITKQLREAVMDYNKSLGDDEKQLRMSFFEQEFPLSSTFYSALNQALNENIDEEAGPRQKVVSLEELTWDLVISMFNKMPSFGQPFPYPNDSHRAVFKERDLEDWKEEIKDKYGNVNVKIDTEAASKWEKIQVLDDKFRADKKAYMSRRNIDEAEELNPLKETIKFAMEDLQGYSDYFPGGKTKGLTPKTLSTILTNIAKDISYDGEELDESTLCKRGQDYIKARKAAGEKSSAYLSGRGVKVCKGQIKFKGKKQKDFKG